MLWGGGVYCLVPKEPLCALNPSRACPSSHQEVTGSDLSGWGGLGFGALGYFSEPSPPSKPCSLATPYAFGFPKLRTGSLTFPSPTLEHTHSTHSREDPQHPFPQRDWNLGGKCELRK